MIACTIAICAETTEEAERIASSGRMMFSLLRMGRLIPIPPPEKALTYLATRERPAEGRHRRRSIVGTPEQVREGLEAVADEYGADEVMVLTITYEHEARRRSYELIAEVMSSSDAPSGDSRRAVGGGTPGTEPPRAR